MARPVARWRSADWFAVSGEVISTADALALIEARVAPVTTAATVGLHAATGRILAADIVADRSVPPHDNAAVDGYAFRFADLSGPETSLRVRGRAAAGHPHIGMLGPGEGVRIFTGATMPLGCDTVAMQEDCRSEGETVTIPSGLASGANRRRSGEDIAAGSVILRRGARLRPQDVGLIASIGIRSVSVYRRLRVALFSTGDEIADPGAPLPEGGVYDANRFVLHGLLKGLGCRVTDLGILADDAVTVRDALDDARRRHDLLVTSGGVSSGGEDHVTPVVESLGHIHFWRLPIKPGRSIMLGQMGSVPIVGLPGNPVAAMVTFLRFARPLILRLGGATDVAPQLFRVRAGFDHRKSRDRREWVRARLVAGEDGSPTAVKFDRQGSGVLSSMVGSDGLVELAEEMIRLEAGTMVDFLPFSEVS